MHTEGAARNCWCSSVVFSKCHASLLEEWAAFLFPLTAYQCHHCIFRMSCQVCHCCGSTAVVPRLHSWVGPVLDSLPWQLPGLWIPVQGRRVQLRSHSDLPSPLCKVNGVFRSRNLPSASRRWPRTVAAACFATWKGVYLAGCWGFHQVVHGSWGEHFQPKWLNFI